MEDPAKYIKTVYLAISVVLCVALFGPDILYSGGEEMYRVERYFLRLDKVTVNGEEQPLTSDGSDPVESTLVGFPFDIACYLVRWEINSRSVTGWSIAWASVGQLKGEEECK